MTALPNSLHHVCGECDSEFVINYNEDNCEDDPIHCPFCGEYLILGDSFTEDEEE